MPWPPADRGDGKESAAVDRLAQTLIELLVGQLAGLEVGLHQLLVALCDRLHELRAPLFHLPLELGRHVARRADAVAILLEGDGLVVHEIDDPAEVVLFADRDLHRDRRAAEALLQLGHRAVEVGVLAIHQCEMEQDRPFHLGGGLPQLFGVDLNAGDTVHAQQDGVGSVEGCSRLGEEDAHARAVEQVDLVLVPGCEAGGQTDRETARDLLVVEVCRGVAVFDALLSIGHPAGVEQTVDERCLADGVVADNREIAQKIRALYLHEYLREGTESDAAI